MTNITKKILATSIAAMLLAGSVTTISFADDYQSDDTERMEQGENKM